MVYDQLTRTGFHVLLGILLLFLFLHTLHCDLCSDLRLVRLGIAIYDMLPRPDAASDLSFLFKSSLFS